MIYLLRLVIFSFVLLNSHNAFGEAFIQDARALKKFKKRIENSTWLVPPNTLIAYYYDNGNTVQVSDQTIWVINEFNEGYFFGDAYTSIDQTPTSHLKLIGSITPSGYVNITFYPTSGNYLNTDAVKATGKFKIKDESPYFTIQIDAPENNQFGLSHWTYMLRVNESDFFYQHVPGENKSVPEFINQFQ